MKNSRYDLLLGMLIVISGSALLISLKGIGVLLYFLYLTVIRALVLHLWESKSRDANALAILLFPILGVSYLMTANVRESINSFSDNSTKRPPGT